MAGLCEGGNEPPGSLKATVKSEEEPIEEDGFRSHPDATLAITGLPFQRQQQQRRLEQGDEFSRQRCAEFEIREQENAGLVDRLALAGL
ncbi:hypothetical protein ANN_18489 [Periplaneta americana]|uniref:Uncharacterized protein n=1 Tax=Periplaneta americana TaxID=6978 RepID=A0ABQ8SNW3_PERAM|nr:hypothetical protein ANN_18489 [Periplaneta americana]